MRRTVVGGGGGGGGGRRGGGGGRGGEGVGLRGCDGMIFGFGSVRISGGGGADHGFEECEPGVELLVPGSGGVLTEQTVVVAHAGLGLKARVEERDAGNLVVDGDLAGAGFLLADGALLVRAEGAGDAVPGGITRGRGERGEGGEEGGERSRNRGGVGGVGGAEGETSTVRARVHEVE